jgi:hypothetical protein
MRGTSVGIAAALLFVTGGALAQAPEPPRWYTDAPAAAGDGAWGLKLGYRLSRGWSLEGGYRDFGIAAPRVAIDPPIVEPFAAGIRPRAWSFAGVELPTPMGRWSSIGAGATYRFSPRWYGRLGWDRYSRAGDEYGGGRGEVDVYGLGLGWRF